MGAWTKFLELFDGRYRTQPGLTALREAFASTYPEYEPTTFKLQAREPDREVVAVIYRPSKNWIPGRGAAPYKLFAINADASVVEVPRQVNGPYEIRGVK